MRERIVEAALETIKTQGLAGSTARAVAKTGGFNAALIYYYFGNLDDLYIAALEHTSASRMDDYVARLSRAASLDELARVARELFDEDVRAGHITVLAELMSAAISSPEMGRRIVERLEPWIRMTQDSIARFTRGSVIEPMISPRAVAESLVALYLGMEMLHHLDGDRSRAERLFDMLSAFVPMIASFFNAAPDESAGDDEA